MVICSKVHKPYITLLYTISSSLEHHYYSCVCGAALWHMNLQEAHVKLSTSPGDRAAFPPHPWVSSIIHTLGPTLSILGRLLLRNERESYKSPIQHLKRVRNKPNTLHGDSRRGAKAGESSTMCQHQVRSDGMKSRRERINLSLYLVLKQVK